MPISKIKAVITIAGFLLLSGFSVSSQEAVPRSYASGRYFDRIFPWLTREQKIMAFSKAGLKNTFTKKERPIIIPASNSGINLLSAAAEKSPTVLVEALIIVPYGRRALNKLDAYNALGRIENISNYLIYSPSRSKYIPLFEESTRLDNAKRNRPIPDPPPAVILPSTETIYMCLKDTFFGNTYFRGEFSEGRHGITYNMTNNTAVWFLVFPVMPAEKFVAILYVEPIAEGMLVYGVAGIDVPEFLTARINLAFQIDRRVTIFINWLTDGLKSIS